MKREGKEDKDGNRKVAGPPVDAHLQPPADRVAIQHDAQEPARRKHLRRLSEQGANRQEDDGKSREGGQGREQNGGCATGRWRSSASRRGCCRARSYAHRQRSQDHASASERVGTGTTLGTPRAPSRPPTCAQLRYGAIPRLSHPRTVRSENRELHSFATLRRVRNQRLFANRASTRV